MANYNVLFQSKQVLWRAYGRTFCHCRTLRKPEEQVYRLVRCSTWCLREQMWVLRRWCHTRRPRPRPGVRSNSTKLLGRAQRKGWCLQQKTTSRRLCWLGWWVLKLIILGSYRFFRKYRLPQLLRLHRCCREWSSQRPDRRTMCPRLHWRRLVGRQLPTGRPGRNEWGVCWWLWERRWCRRMQSPVQTSLPLRRIGKNSLNLEGELTNFSESTALSTVAHGDRLGQSLPELESGESATWTRAQVVALVDICLDATTSWKLAPGSLWTVTYALMRSVPPNLPSDSNGVARISNSRIPTWTKLGHWFQRPANSPFFHFCWRAQNSMIYPPLVNIYLFWT